MCAASTSSLKHIVRQRSNQSLYQVAYLDTRLASQATLEVHQSTAELVAHGRLAVLSASCRHTLAASSCGAASGGALGSKRALAGVAVVAQAAGVCCGLPGGGGSTSDGVPGSGLRDTSGLGCLLASEAGQEAWFATSGSGRSGSCASAGHCV